MGFKNRHFTWKSQLASPIASLSPYRTEQVDAPIKLHANESPFSLPTQERKELAELLAQVPLNRYPDPSCNRLRNNLSRKFALEPSQLVFGNGSDELISMLIQAFGNRGAGSVVMYPGPTFSVYRLTALANQCLPVEVPVNPDFSFNESRFWNAVATHRPAICFFALPNNPTGTLWPMDFPRRLAKRYPETIVVSDEAYFDFCGETNLPFLRDLPNLVVLRTLSKIGMASLRLGFSLASFEVSQILEAVRPPYNIGGFNQVAAMHILSNGQKWLSESIETVITQRQRLADELEQLPAIKVYPSKANLLMIRFGVGEADRVWHELVEIGILVRKFSHPMLRDCLRVTVGSPRENDLLISALRSIIA